MSKPMEGTKKYQVWHFLDYLEKAQQQKIDADGFVTTKINFSWLKDAVEEFDESAPPLKEERTV